MWTSDFFDVKSSTCSATMAFILLSRLAKLQSCQPSLLKLQVPATTAKPVAAQCLGQLLSEATCDTRFGALKTKSDGNHWSERLMENNMYIMYF